MKKTISALLLAAIAWIAGCDGGPPSPDPQQSLPTRAFADLEGGERSLAHWHGQVRLVNLWATWCGPCREEVPLLLELQRRHAGEDFTVIGIALDDADAVRDFAATLGIDYPLLLAGEAGTGVLTEFGNAKGVVPYSLLLDRDGRVAARWPGLLRREPVETALQPLLEK